MYGDNPVVVGIIDNSHDVRKLTAIISVKPRKIGYIRNDKKTRTFIIPFAPILTRGFIPQVLAKPSHVGDLPTRVKPIWSHTKRTLEPCCASPTMSVHNVVPYCGGKATSCHNAPTCRRCLCKVRHKPGAEHDAEHGYNNHRPSHDEYYLRVSATYGSIALCDVPALPSSAGCPRPDPPLLMVSDGQGRYRWPAFGGASRHAPRAMVPACSSSPPAAC